MENTEEKENKNPGKIVFGSIIFAFAFIFGKMNFPKWVILIYSLLSYLILGYEVLEGAFKNILKGEIFDEDFLMSVATIGALALGEFYEAITVMLLFCIGEYLEDAISEKAGKSIEELLDITPENAHLIMQNGEMKTLPPAMVKVDNIVRVLNGEKVPLDGFLLSESTYADTKAITGESTPKRFEKGDFISSGYIIINGTADIKVSAIYEESTVSKIIEFTENSEKNRGKTEKFITRFSHIYTPIVCGIALSVAIIPSLLTGSWSLWIKRALTFLIVSCPCALVISIPLVIFAGMGKCSSEGILVKGGIQLENLAKADIFAFDKTGTITEGKFKVRAITGQNTLAYAYSLEKFSNHPIATAIVNESEKQKIKSIEMQDVSEEPGFGIKGKSNGLSILCGNEKMMKKYGIDFIPHSADYSTVVYVAYANEYSGYIEISDQIKKDALDSLISLRKSGIRQTVLLSGDGEKAVSYVAGILGFDQYHSSLLPLGKVEEVRKLQEKGSVAFVGDGINDAPVLNASDIGISMGKLGSDIAIESSGAVITSDNIERIPVALNIAKKSMLIAKQNIVLSLGIKFVCMALSIFGFTSMILAVFADTGVTLLCVLNSMRALSKN